MEHFYLTLPSNSSMNVFPNNKLNSYKVKLPKALPTTEGKWLVGLYEIQFPKTWYNVTLAWVKIRLNPNSDPINITIKDGYYTDIDQLLAYMRNVFIADARIPEEKILFFYDQICNRLILKVLEDSDGSPIAVAFSQNLLNIFAKM